MWSPAKAGGEGHVSVLDTQTDAPSWFIKLGQGIRPMTMSRNPDGSTRTLFVQIGDYNGFVVVDFQTAQGSHADHTSEVGRRENSADRGLI
jgi:hypothetical protein